MDWARAIERNSEALKGIVAALFAMLGLAGGATLARIPRSAPPRRAERAAARRIRRAAPYRHRGAGRCGEARTFARPCLRGPSGTGQGGQPSVPPFSSSIRANASHHAAAESSRASAAHPYLRRDPRMAALWSAPGLAAPAPPPDGLVDAERLIRRLEALKLALEDLPGQARRLARWRARRENAPSPKFKSPLRPGRPPGYRRKPVHLVDDVLTECHGLACDAMRPDTS